MRTTQHCRAQKRHSCCRCSTKAEAVINAGDKLLSRIATSRWHFAEHRSLLLKHTQSNNSRTHCPADQGYRKADACVYLVGGSTEKRKTASVWLSLVTFRNRFGVRRSDAVVTQLYGRERLSFKLEPIWVGIESSILKKVPPLQQRFQQLEARLNLFQTIIPVDCFHQRVHFKSPNDLLNYACRPSAWNPSPRFYI